GRAAAPARVAARAPAGLLAAMPGWVNGMLGCKLVSVFPENETHGRRGHQALIALFEADHGEPVAILDGTAITAMRTGLVSALATRCLARSEARVLAVLGTGVQARSHLNALPLVRRFVEIRVAGRNRTKAAALAAECGASVASDFEAAVRGADVVCCCTHAAEPILRRAWLAPGAHVNSVGIGGRELDAATIAAAEVLAVESPVTFAPFPAGAHELQGVDPARGTELGVLLASVAPPPSRSLTVFKSVGHAVEDVAAAAWVWRATINAE
ncbi:MAG: ornithine cyclodeaminase family protein, partial [Terriglobales bacterium]